MSSTPDKQAPTKPTKQTPTPTGDAQQNAINPISNAATAVPSQEMNQAFDPANFFQLPEISQTPTPTSYLPQNGINNSAGFLLPPGMNQTLDQTAFLQLNMNQSPNFTGFMHSSGTNQALNSATHSATLSQPSGTNQTLSQTNIVQSSGPNQASKTVTVAQLPEINRTINSENLAKPSGTNQIINTPYYFVPTGDQTFNQANCLYTHGTNQNVNPLGYQQQPRMNPGLNPMGSQQQFGMGLNTPNTPILLPDQSSPSTMRNSQTRQMVVQPKKVSARAPTPTTSSAGPTMLPNAPSSNNRPSTPRPPASKSPIVNMNQYINPNMNCTRIEDMKKNKITHQQTHHPVPSGLQHMSTGNGTNVNFNMNMNMNMIPFQQSHVPVANVPYNFTNMNMNMDSSQYLEVATNLQYPSIGNGMSVNMNFPPSTGNSVPIRPPSRLPRAGSLTQALRRNLRAQSQVLGPQHPDPTRVKKTLSGNASNSSDCLKNHSINHSITTNMTSKTPHIKRERKARTATEAAIVDGALIVTRAVTPKPTPSNDSQVVPLSSRQQVQQPVQKQNQELVHNTVKKEPVQDPVQDSAQQSAEQPVQQPGAEERTAPDISRDEVLELLTDTHWEYWHRINVLKLHELAEAQSDASIRQAWNRRLSDRWFSEDYMRVYELGGFLYEVKTGPYGEFPPVTPIPWREYAESGVTFRPTCCASVDKAQALVEVQQRALGNIPPHILDLNDAQAQSESMLQQGIPGTGWRDIARSARDMDGWMRHISRNVEPVPPPEQEMDEFTAALMDMGAE